MTRFELRSGEDQIRLYIYIGVNFLGKKNHAQTCTKNIGKQVPLENAEVGQTPDYSEKFTMAHKRFRRKRFLRRKASGLRSALKKERTWGNQ